MTKRTHMTRARVAILVGTIALATSLGGVGTVLVLASSQPPSATPNRAAEAVSPNPYLAGRMLSVKTERFDKDVRTTTHSFAEFDDDGVLVRYRNTTRGTNGELIQEQAFENGLEVVNYADWMGTGAACSELLDFAIPGTGIPIVSESYLQSTGFTPTDLPTGFGFDGTERAFESRTPGRPLRGFPGSTTIIVASGVGGLELARLAYGTTGAGEATLVSSFVRTFELVDEVPPGTWQLAALPACPGHRPFASGGAR